MGPLCAVWVHILCLTIHFWTLLIWFFNVTKNQNRTSRLSWKVGGGQRLTWFWYDFFPEFHVCRYLAIALGYENSTPGESFDRHFMPPKNSKILARFYLRNWRFLDKKCQNFKKFSLAQYDPISLLNPWNRFI